jgi:hypothetical protein
MASSIGNGGVSAAESTSIEVAASSTAPVASLSFTIPSGRARTVPVTRSTHSERTRWAASSASDCLGVGDDLQQAGAVTQVEERDAAVVAAGVDPSGDGDGLAGVFGTQGAGAVGAHGAEGGDAHVGGPSCRWGVTAARAVDDRAPVSVRAGF